MKSSFVSGESMRASRAILRSLRSVDFPPLLKEANDDREAGRAQDRRRDTHGPRGVVMRKSHPAPLAIWLGLIPAARENRVPAVDARRALDPA